nr:MAG TPA: hypothetical protein [Caudoviricetes sp.]
MSPPSSCCCSVNTLKVWSRSGQASLTLTRSR